MGPENYSAVNMQHSSRQGKKDPKGDSEIMSPLSFKRGRTFPGFQQHRWSPSRAIGSLLCPACRFERLELPKSQGTSPRLWQEQGHCRKPLLGWCPAEPWGHSHLPQARETTECDSIPGKPTHNTPTCESCHVGFASHPIRKDYYQSLQFDVVCPVGFWTYLGPATPFFPSSLF